MIRSILVSVACLVALPALAQDIPSRFTQGLPQEKGQWKMEFLEGGPGMANAGPMRICRELKDGFRGPQGGGKGQAECTSKVLKDTASSAQVQVSCPNRKPTLIDMTRESDKSMIFAMTQDDPESKGLGRMRIRYTYEGACTDATRGGGMVMDKSNPQCQQMAAAAAKMDPAQRCARAPADQRAACEQTMRAQIDRMKAMCQ